MTMTINGSGSITGLSAGGLPSATINQANLNTNVAGNGPAFSYYQSSAQTLSTTTFTKLTFTTSDFDATGGMYSSSRFTPTVAGYYQVNSAVSVAAAATQVILSVFKNGTEYKRSPNNTGAQNSGGITCLVYLNGSTDYIEMYGYLGVGQALITGSIYTYFQASMVRAA